MRETKSVCELEDLRNRIEKEEMCSECLRNTLPLRTVRTNGVVPHQSRASCMPSAHPGTWEITKVLVTGGAGYLGHNLGLALTKLGYTVILFDVHKPDLDVGSGVTFVQVNPTVLFKALKSDIQLWRLEKPPVFHSQKVLFVFQGDIRDYNSLYDACEGVDCVFHAASFGMSGYQQVGESYCSSLTIVFLFYNLSY